MTDIALAPMSSGGYDIQLAGHDLAAENGLRTAVLVSLFSDRLATADDAIPDGTDNRRGWWADAWPEIPDDLTGSRLWLLAREKQTAETAERAREYAAEALQWMVDDGVARAVDVTAAWDAPGRLALTIAITRATGQAARYQFAWNAEVRHAV